MVGSYRYITLENMKFITNWAELLYIEDDKCALARHAFSLSILVKEASQSINLTGKRVELKDLTELYDEVLKFIAIIRFPPTPANAAMCNLQAYGFRIYDMVVSMLIRGNVAQPKLTNA